MKQDADALRHVKADLRASALALRDGLDPAFRAVASAQAAALALPLFRTLSAGAVVSGFFPMRSEVDPRPLMQALAAKGFKLALPCVTPDGLAFRLWALGDPLAKRRFGLSEPLNTAPAVRPDAFIVPLAAFDRRCHRIGYGAGHYDRALAQCPQALKIGIGFAAQEIPAVPNEPHDQVLDAVVTEEGVVRSSV
jgi:5-formyltetrahydrofolate cyclo-ligase